MFPLRQYGRLSLNSSTHRLININRFYSKMCQTSRTRLAVLQASAVSQVTKRAGGTRELCGVGGVF